MSKNIPLVVLLDLDGTIIGNISPQVCEWELLMQHAPKRMKQFKENLHSQLHQGLLRPHFISFIDFMKHNYNNAEIFIYTASESKWAHVIIACIEQLTGITFNRPLFTRANCIATSSDLKKSFDKVIPLMYNKLKHNYSIDTQASLKQHIIMVDNYHEVLVSGSQERRLVKCPTYSFTCFYDVLRLLDEEVVKTNYLVISETLVSYKMFPNISSSQAYSYEVFKVLYFEMLASNVKNSIKQNSIQDSFWQQLMQSMSKIDSSQFKDSTIKHINQRIKT
jgi:hypothetical protein